MGGDSRRPACPRHAANTPQVCGKARQERPSLQSETGQALLEIPAGTLEPNEPPADTARRELAEEVGLAAATWTEGPRFYTAPGFCTELMHLYLATDLSEQHADGDDDEQLEPSWMTLPDALAAIDDGRLMDAKTIAAIGWLARRLSR